MSNLSSRKERRKSQRGSVEVRLGQGEKGLPGTLSHRVASCHPRFREMSDTISAAKAVGLLVSSGTVFLIVSKVRFTLHQPRTRQRGFRGTQPRSKLHRNRGERRFDFRRSEHKKCSWKTPARFSGRQESKNSSFLLSY